MPSFKFGADADLGENQLLSAVLERRVAVPTTARAGRAWFPSASLTGYDGVDLIGRPAVATTDGAAGLADYRFLPGLNRPETIVGRWTFAPSAAGVTSVGLLTAPPAPGNPQSIGTLYPFSVSGQSRLSSGWERTPDTDGAGDFTQPSVGLKRYVPNWVAHLCADTLDGYHATLDPLAYAIAVRRSGGQVKVPLDPDQDTDATSKGYVDSRTAGIMRTRTACQWATLAPLPAHSFNSSTRTLTASANGALSVDGGAPAVGDRIIVRKEASLADNAICTVSATGNGGAPWVLREVYGTSTDGDAADNPDPDELGSPAYGDYFVVTAGATYAGSAWTMNGGLVGDIPGLTDPVSFGLFQLSTPLQGGRGLVMSGGRVHFYKSAYAGADLNGFPYLASDVNGTSALALLGLYGAAGAFVLRGGANRIPRTSSDTAVAFADSGMADDGTALYPADSRKLGKSGFSWSEAWIAPTAAGAKFTGVMGVVSSDLVQQRNWATFVADLQADLPFLSYTPTARTLRVWSPNGTVQVSTTTAVDMSANREWSIDVLHAAPSVAVGLSAAGGVAATSLRSDARLAIDQAISPTWSAVHAFGAGLSVLSANVTPTHVGVFASSPTGAPVVLGSCSVAALGAAIGASVSPTLAEGAVGFGNALNLLSGSTALLSFVGLNLGVGTATPLDRLHVNGAARVSRLAAGTGATPDHLVDIGAGTSTVAPARFSTTANALLSSITPGALEVDITGLHPVGRLWFTDGQPIRHGLAFLDDVSHTNDPIAAEGGGLRFFAPVSGALCTADLKSAIGTGAFTAFVRVFVPVFPSAVYYPTVFSLVSNTSPDITSVFAYLELSGGSLTFTCRLGNPANDVSVVTQAVGGRSFATLWGGKVVDIAFVRDSAGVRAYANGAPLALSGDTADVRWQRTLSANCEFRTASFGGTGSNTYWDRVYRSSLFNRAMAQVELGNLSRFGVADSDRWGAVATVYSSNFGTTADGWTASTTGGSNGAVARVAGPIMGRSNLLRLTSHSTGSETAANRGTLSRGRRYRITADILIPAANVNIDGVRIRLFGDRVATAVTPTRDTWTTVTFEAEDSLTTTATDLFSIVGTKGGLVVFTGNGTDLVYVSAVSVTQVGCLVDLDLDHGLGSVVPDRSGRYPSKLTGAWEWTKPRKSAGVPLDPTDADPLDPVTGDGVMYSDVRKLVVRRSFADDTSRVITHGLGAGAALSVSLWDRGFTPPQLVASWVEATSADTVTVAVGKIGGARNLDVVIVG